MSNGWMVQKTDSLKDLLDCYFPVPLTWHEVDSSIRVSNTDVSLDKVIELFLEERSLYNIHEELPVIPLHVVFQVIGFYLEHSDLINQYLRDKEAELKQQLVDEQELKRFD
jgi:hypothetical protein